MADPACGVPTDVTLTLRFDRFLLPTTAIRQSVTMYTGAAGNVAPPPSNTRPELSPQYDPLERTVRYVLPPGFRLHPHALYTVELPVYNDEQPFGFRAFDGAPLAGSGAVRLSFRTGAGPAGTPPAPPAPVTCADFVARFGNPHLTESCGFLGCHGDGGAGHASPSMGLVLDSGPGLRATAIRHVAHQADTGDTTGSTEQAPLRFGANMPIIDPGRPENSYLVYKLLIGATAYLPEVPGDCPSGSRCEPPSLEEIARLRSWFVRGESMPFATSPDERFVHFAEVKEIEAFILGGDECLDTP